MYLVAVKDSRKERYDSQLYQGFSLDITTAFMRFSYSIQPD